MRLSTTNPTGTLRSRRAANSMRPTYAPETQARIQMLKKLKMRIRNTRPTTASNPPSIRVGRVTAK